MVSPEQRDERIRLLETALVECFDIAIPQAMPWTGTFSEKAEYAAKMLPQHLRGLFRLYDAKLGVIAKNEAK